MHVVVQSGRTLPVAIYVLGWELGKLTLLYRACFQFLIRFFLLANVAVSVFVRLGAPT